MQQAVNDGLEAAIAKCRSGMPMREVQKAIASVAVKHGVRFLHQPMIRILVHESSHLKRDARSDTTNVNDDPLFINDCWRWLETAAASKAQTSTQLQQVRSTCQIPERLESGMVINIRPIYVEGHHACVQWANGWTSSTVDGGLAVQAEGTIFINDHGETEEM